MQDSWAICRIFKKTSPITPRTHSHSWVSPSLPNPNPNLNSSTHSLTSTTCNNPNFSPENITNSTSCSSPMQSNSNYMNELDKILQLPNSFSFLDHLPTFKPIYPNDYDTTSNDNLFPNIATLLDLPPSYILPQLEEPSQPPSKSNNIDISSMFLNMSSSILEHTNKHSDVNVDFGMLPNINGQCLDFPIVTLSQDHMQHNNEGDNNQQDYACTLLGNLNNMLYAEDECHAWDEIHTVGSIPISSLLPPLAMPEAWKSPSMWDCAPPLS